MRFDDRSKHIVHCPSLLLGYVVAAAIVVLVFTVADWGVIECVATVVRVDSANC